ncbi:ASC-1-like (ASCH) protein [Catenulispora sp. GAS73]|uniref:ASCH domain-containing protein n=1 Tax=Catenulispora sp. GAS73 TaxID=3156269 RepID=UPI003519370E
MSAELNDSGMRAASDQTAIVALCGSRAAESLRQAEADLTLAGKVVLTPFLLSHLSRTPMGPPERDRVRALDRARIAIADEVVVVNPDRYITDSAFEEIAFALQLGRPVAFTEPVTVMGLRSQFFDAFLSGAKTIEVRRLDPKRLALRPGEIIRFDSGQRSLLARVTTLRHAPSAEALLSGLDASAVVPGADRDELAKILEEIYPGLFDVPSPMVAIGINMVGELPIDEPSRQLPAGCSITWHPGPPPAGIPVTGAAGWLVDPVDGRVLVQQREGAGGACRFALPGGGGELVDDGDPLATLSRVAIEELLVEIDAAIAVYLGCQIITGHPDLPEPHAKACFLVPISLYDPIGPAIDDPAGRTHRRFMTSIGHAAQLVVSGRAGGHEASAALVAARALGICVDKPAPAGFRDDGDAVPVTGSGESR